MSDVAVPRGPIFSHRGVTITREIADIRGTSYPINGIGSVRVAEPKRFGYILLGVLVLLGGFALGALGILTLIIGVGLITYAFRMPHVLVIHTASGDRSALSGKREPMLAIKQAIETAVTMRG